MFITFLENHVDKNNLIESTNYNLPYGTRIHYIKSCQCKRIHNKLAQLVNHIPDYYVIYIIEKIWKDIEYKNSPNYICLICRNDGNFENIYHNSLENRKNMFNYFSKNQWLRDESIMIRSIVKNMDTVCFCRNELISNITKHNAGTIIIGDHRHLLYIKEIFNKYVTNDEILELHVFLLKNVKNIPDTEISHNLNLFLKSQEIDKLDQTLGVLVGTEYNKYSNDKIKTKFTLSFGKREWIPNGIETSLICAKREMYEEFHIQISESIFDYSRSIDKPQIIHGNGIILYFIYLPNKIRITYHRKSETIYLAIPDS